MKAHFDVHVYDCLNTIEGPVQFILRSETKIKRKNHKKDDEIKIEIDDDDDDEDYEWKNVLFDSGVNEGI